MKLDRDVGSNHVTYRLLDEYGATVSPERWAEHEPALPAPSRATIACLRLLLENEQAWAGEDGSVTLAHAAIATMPDRDARALGLPAAVPYTLQLRSRGTIDQPSFRVEWQFVDSFGRPVLGAKRTGALLQVGHHWLRLPEPFFSLLETIDRLNAIPPGGVNERFLAVGELEHLLPDGTLVEGYLKNTRIARASAFTLNPYVGADGEVTFDPVLMRPARPSMAERQDDLSAQETKEPKPVEALPPHYQQGFASRFRERRTVLPRYVLSDGWFVVLDERIVKALSVVRGKQEAPVEERRAFLRNPYAALREELGEEIEALKPPHMDSEEYLSSLFVEPPEYGARVEGVGAWVPKVIPWVVQPPSPWLPPEKVGIRIGDRSVDLDRSKLPELAQRIEQAIQDGSEAVAFDGTVLPATREVLEAVQALEKEVASSVEGAEEKGAERERRQLILVIKDNLETVTYAPTPRRHRSSETDIESILLSEFKPHQRDGFEWLKRHWIRGDHGVLLADDMGLGKTLQALAFLAWVRQEMEAGFVERAPMLVVAPTGLLKNWEAEHDRHLCPPGLGHLLRLYGQGLRDVRTSPGGGRSIELSAGGIALERSRLERADWVLTTYETVRDYQHSLGSIRWAVMVLDEAQKTKTPGTLMTEAVKAMHAEFTIAMTGTPVENRLADLWCIIDTVQPALLGDLKTFSRRYEDAAIKERLGRLRELRQKLDESEPEPPPRPKVLLRRMKGAHLRGLPPKHEHALEAKMPPVQAERYAQVVDQARAGDAQPAMMLATLNLLRQVSLHPLAFDDPGNDEQYVAASARLSEAMRVLDDIAERGEKALIYVDLLEFQRVLQALVQRRYRLSRPPLVINGNVSGERRKQRVDEFQGTGGFDVMILSPRAGGVGLTLTAATHVIHLSRWWNPAVEDQCSDRVYRIGQERAVHIYYPMAVHPEFGEYSFDRQLDALLRQKRDLSNTVLAPGELTEDDRRQLFEATVGAAPASAALSRQAT